jgi:hypothetical protein
MSTLEQIEAAILTLPSDELRRLRQWFADMVISGGMSS